VLTGMTEDDWTIVLKVFAAAQSCRGQPGRNDRKFLEALHFFTVHNLTWRARSPPRSARGTLSGSASGGSADPVSSRRSSCVLQAAPRASGPVHGRVPCIPFEQGNPTAGALDAARPASDAKGPMRGDE
jgi:hypothetical protein